MRKNFHLLLALVVVLAMPLTMQSGSLASEVLIFGLAAMGCNLLLGYTGLLSFGHAAFLGGAAYICGYAIKDVGATPEIGLLAGTASGALLGLVMGWFTIRRQGIYATMITLALAQMLFFACLQAPFTGGEDGLQGVPRGKLFGLLDLQSDLVMYYVTVVIATAAFLLIVRTIHSPFGQVLKGIKENEARATSLGYDTNRFKLLAFVISAAIAGLAGSLKTLVLGFATLSDVHWSMSGHVVLMTLVGGMGTLSGPLVGAVVVVALENKIGDLGAWLARTTGVEWFSTLGQSVTIVTGLIFIVCVLAFRRGIMGELIAWLQGRGKS